MGDREESYREIFKNNLNRGEYNNAGKLRMKKDLMNSRYEYFKHIPNQYWHRIISFLQQRKSNSKLKKEYTLKYEYIKDMPNQKWHRIISFIKSGIRILGYIFIPFNLVIATIILIISEVIGIIEELV